MAPSCGSKGGEAAAPTILCPGLVRPAAFGIHAVADASVRCLRGEDEAQRQTAEPMCDADVRLSNRNNEQAGVVVGAQPVLGPTPSSLRMLEDAVLVAEPVQVVEVVGSVEGNSHMATGWRVWTSPSASSAYSAATDDQLSDGAMRRASTAMDSSRSESVTTDRMASDMVCGSP